MTIQRIDVTGGSGVEHRVLRDLAAMEDVADAWRALDARAADPLTYFQSFDWCHRWIATYGGPHCRPEIHTLWQGGRLVAVWPLMLSGGRLKRLEPLSTPHCQYANMLVDPALGQPLARRLIADLAGAGFDLALIEGVPEGSALAALFGNTAPLAARRNTASMLDLTAFASPDSYLQRLSKTQRRNRNRRRNALARHGELSFEVLFPGDKGFEEAIALFLRHKRHWLRETARRGHAIASADFDRFLGALPGDRDALSGACFFLLKAGDRMAAGELGFLHHGHYYAYLGAFDWELRDASPGKTQMDMTVCWLIGEGVKTYDLLGHPTDYKESWSNRTTVLETYALPANLAGRAYIDLWTVRLRPGLQKLYRSLPHQLRRLAQFGQSFGLFLMIA
ncbi:GNAT family N-acetyltransferase [Shinella sp. PSBB067]|uniref:GNAT family N-acetyltransferase n=1 Tax=Shinella sp. PSBB067 TaxID=2715959 RepID=UPI00193BEAC3|nr:GNAT family N-acetyltransferase [Shinella sp. PSBB067]QRI64337.1 GNAT family N-acetyltransferase [Shinella sp. PSBB067]